MHKKILFILIWLPSLVLAKASQPLDHVVAIVNKEVITASELETQTEAYKQQLIINKQPLPDAKSLRKQALQYLIDVALQIQMASDNNISIDDKEVNDGIEKIATTNRLTLAQLREEVSKQGLAYETYRNNIKKEITIAKLQQKALVQEIVISSQQIDDFIKLNQHNQKKAWIYRLQTLVVPLSEDATNQQIKRAHNKALALLKQSKNGQEFEQLEINESDNEFSLESNDLGDRQLSELPELFAKQVIQMRKGDIAGPLRAGNGFQVIKLVNITGNNDGKHAVTKTHVRHILLKPRTNMTSLESEQQINNIYQQLKAGSDFHTIAKKHSADTASAVQGGDLGWVSPEELVPQFAQAMNSLPVRTISKPVKSPFGWHIIEVLERKTVDDSQAFERQQAKQILYQRKFTESLQNWLQNLRTNAYIKILDKELA